MDLLTSATTFATIVGLLSNFKSERSGGELSDFIAWLKQKNHEDVASNIASNKSLVSELSQILATNHDELCEKLSALNDIIAGIASNISLFSALASSTNPESIISDQAVSIIRQLVESGAKEFLEIKVKTGDPDTYTLMGVPGEIKYNEPRFMEDDLNTLVALGLLRLEFGSRGSRRFQVTRNAVNFVSVLDR